MVDVCFLLNTNDSGTLVFLLQNICDSAIFVFWRDANALRTNAQKLIQELNTFWRSITQACFFELYENLKVQRIDTWLDVLEWFWTSTSACNGRSSGSEKLLRTYPNSVRYFLTSREKKLEMRYRSTQKSFTKYEI